MLESDSNNLIKIAIVSMTHNKISKISKILMQISKITIKKKLFLNA